MSLSTINLPPSSDFPNPLNNVLIHVLYDYYPTYYFASVGRSGVWASQALTNASGSGFSECFEGATRILIFAVSNFASFAFAFTSTFTSYFQSAEVSRRDTGRRRDGEGDALDSAFFTLGSGGWAFMDFYEGTQLKAAWFHCLRSVVFEGGRLGRRAGNY